ncbi:MAG: GNAT family N-acetyltransferase [Prevotella sp.]|jgi:diamine N-acetyltransferase
MITESLPLVRLRAIEPEDLDYLYKIENDKRLWGVGETNMPYSRYALHEYVANCPTDIYTDRQLRLMIDTSEGETVGIADLMNFDPRHLRAEIGIVVDKLHRGKGYAHAALAELLDYGTSVIHLHQVYAIVSADNDGSLRLFHRIGFESHGELKEWLFDGKGYHDAIIFQKILEKKK